MITLKSRFLFICFVAIFSGTCNIFGADIPTRDGSDKSPKRHNDVFSEWAELKRREDLDNKTMGEVFKKALKDGFHGGIKETTRQVVTSLFRVFPSSINQILPCSSLLTHRFVFRSKGLVKTDLVRISNRIFSLCSPFTNLSIGNLDKKRRAALIKREQDPENQENKVNFDQNSSWPVMQKELITELEYAILYLNKNRACYDLEYLNTHKISLRYYLASLIHTISNEDFDHIAFYIKQSVKYLEQLIVIFENCKYEEQVYERHEEIKRYLNWTIGAFEQISFFIDITKSKTSYASNNFKNVNMNSSSGMSSLESINSKDPLV